ncbi:hypothetical protein [Streptosporangium roseum]|uniref:hypothetical protein n=1 Tax=Streptosporangium roseum TaxID=2001 RepID=UPI00331F59F4
MSTAAASDQVPPEHQQWEATGHVITCQTSPGGGRWWTLYWCTCGAKSRLTVLPEHTVLIDWEARFHLGTLAFA